MRRALALLIATGLCAAGPAHAEPEPEPYLQTYGMPIGLTVGGAGLFLAAQQVDGGLHPLIGPGYTADAPHADIDHDYTAGEQVSKEALALGLGISFLASPLLAVGEDDAWWVAHDGALGFVGTVVSTLAITEVAKNAVGRLRPDYAGRVRHCAAHPTAGACEDGSLLADGRKSFPSGHSSTAFAAATWLSLRLGGRFIWRDDSPTYARIGAGAAAAGLLAGASYVAWTRVDDHWHNPSDVLTGGAIGVGMAAAWYFWLFDGQGKPRSRKRRSEGATVNLAVAPGMLTAAGTF